MNSRNVNINLTRVKFKNNHVVYENFAKCTIKDYEFNLSYNPTLMSGSQALLVPYTYTSGSYTGSQTFYEVTGSKYFGILKDFATGSISGSDFSPYVTTIGLYNDAQELLAVAKMAVPTPLSPNTDMTFLVKFDTQWNNKPYFTPTPSPSRTPYPTQETPSNSPTPSITATPTVTPTVTPTSTPSTSINNSPSVSATPTATVTPTPTISLTPSISVTPTVTPSTTPPANKIFSNWALDSGTSTWSGNSSSGTVYGYSTGTSGTTIITGTLVVSGGSQNISVCAAPGGTSELVTADCDLVGATTYNFLASDNTAGSPTCDNQLVAPGTYTVILRGTFGPNSSGQSVYIN